jgi:hypothetical protein
VVELRKTGANEYDVVSEERVIQQVWNWHGNWSAEANGKTHHNLKSRKEAIARPSKLSGSGRNRA